MRSKQLGATAVEFALILPLLLLVVDGVTEFSSVMYDKVIITHAAREAVRAGVVLRTPKLSTDEIADVAHRYCADYLLSFGAVSVPTVVVTQTTDPAFQTPLEVTVSYTYRSLLVASALSAIHVPMVMASRATGMNE
jgi:Flp pilus assembly protein TadG